MISRALAAFSLLICTPSLAQVAGDRPGRPVSFVACPQFRDTARQCWQAEAGGKTYYIGGFGIGTPPQLLHRVLVEGVARDGETSCGAINIEPVHLSPLPELDLGCDTVLPDNGAAPREGSLFDLPAEALARNGGDVGAPPPLGADQTFVLLFDYDRAVLNLINQAKLEMVARTIMNSPVRRIVVTGYSGISHLTDGSTMREEPRIAAERVKVVSDALKAIGVNPSKISGTTVEATATAMPTPGPESRKVTIAIAL